MAFTCAKCGIPMDTEGGLKRHLTTKHGGYTQQDLRDTGIEPTQRDIARSLDGGNMSIDDVIANAPENESDAKQNKPGKRQNKEIKSQMQDLEDFRRLRPQLVERWKRRLRVPYSMWARLANDPEIALSDKEVTEGAEMHVDFCEAMGWLKAGKVEAIVDIIFWHGATGLSRSQLGKQLLAQFSAENPNNDPNAN